MSEKQERIIFSRDIYDLPDIDGFNVEFKLNDSTVYTREKQLVVDHIKTLDNMDGPIEIKRYTRADLLVIEGILCYFTGYPFTVYELKESKSSRIKKGYNPSKKIQNSVFHLEGKNHSKDLSLLLEKLKDKESKTLVITLLDRWRKALYMVTESEVDTYHDEAILTHFHILELLINYYYDDFKKEATEEIESFLGSFSTEVLNQSGKFKKNTVNSKLKLLKEILIKDEASIATKINYFLNCHSMLDEYTYSLVNKIVKIRNSIAHGRISYKKRLIWPLSPFFNITSIDSRLIIDQIQILSARAIAVHLGLSSWKDSWKSVHEMLPPSEETLMNFIKNSEEHKKVIGCNLISGTYKHITVESLINYYIDNKSKCTFIELEKALSETLLEVPVNEKNSQQLFLASILLSDSNNPKISRISQNNVNSIHQNDWYGYSNIKDIVRYFNYYGIEVQWLYSWIEKGGHLEK